MTALDDSARAGLLRRGFAMEYATLAWNVVGVVILAVAAVAAAARSVALAGFGLDSLIEIAASVVVVWELSDRARSRRRLALRLIGAGLDNPVLLAEGRVTLIDALPALAILCGLVLNAAVGWWWADPAACFVLVCYAVREARALTTR
jgi:divalent metal cation (Fe/Co/Zn/Cd) transporter